MLVQSSENEIHLSPALPYAWNEGSVKGICSRSGFEVSMEWSGKRVKKLGIFAKNTGKTTFYYGN
jgi:alpha-L-fucosidase 2